ncbi:MAG: M56 family metallopeptidase, partial [Bacteroidota bacterium]
MQANWIEFLTYLAESSILAAFFALLYLPTARHRRKLAFHRLYLLLTPGIALVGPALRTYWQTHWVSTFPQLELPALEVSVSLVEVDTVSPGLPGPWGLYALIGGFILTGYLIQWALLAYHTRSFKAETLLGQRVFFTRGALPTSACLGKIFWNDQDDLDDQAVQYILRHEMAHNRQRHGWDVILYQAWVALWWFNPLIYFAHRELRLIHELQADEFATQDSLPQSYLRLLTALSLGSRTALLTPFQASFIKARARYLVKPTHGHRGGYFAWVLVGLLGLGMLPSLATPSLDADALWEVDQMPQPINLDKLQRAIGYPLAARERSVEGTVVARILIAKDGSYLKHKVTASPSPLLTEAVERYLDQIRFTPPTHQGEPTITWVSVP